MSDRGEENITDQTKVFDALIEKAVKRAVQAQVDKVRETMAELLPEMMKSHHPFRCNLLNQPCDRISLLAVTTQRQLVIHTGYSIPPQSTTG